MPNTRHDCPGQCGRTVRHDQVACHWCWPQLPSNLRRAISTTFAARLRNPADTSRALAHRIALQDCLTWYRDNTTKETTTP